MSHVTLVKSNLFKLNKISHSSVVTTETCIIYFNIGSKIKVRQSWYDVFEDKGHVRVQLWLYNSVKLQIKLTKRTYLYLLS